MTNEVVKNENLEVEIVEGKKIDLPMSEYNTKVGDDIIGLQIKCKKIKNDNNDFTSVKGMLYLPVYKLQGDEMVFEGKKNRWIDVHFVRTAFKGTPKECEVATPDDLSTGILYIRKKGIQVPSKYVVTKDEDGKDVYPEIWVRSDIVGFVPYTPDDDMFKYHEPVQEGKISVTEEDEETKSFTEEEK